MKRVTNTSKIPEEERVERTVAGLCGAPGAADAIRSQEAEGQRELVQSCQLPAAGTVGREDTWAAIGVRLGPVDESDPLFRPAELPDGWTRRATEHAMWSELVDDRGAVRAMIFYKAAFYDRKAHASLCRRFEVRQDYDAIEREGVVRADVVDARGEVGHREEVHAPSSKEFSGENYEAMDRVERLCRAWLDDNYPDHMDPLAYWGRPGIVESEDC